MRFTSTTVSPLALISIALLTCFAGISLAQQPATARTDKETLAADGNLEKYDSWVERMKSPRSSDRRSATRELQSMGISVHPVLRHMAETGDAETAIRAIELLREASRSRNEAVAESARQSLEGIAKKDGAGAKVAEDILKGPTRPSRSLPPAIQGQQRFRQLQMKLAQPMRRQIRISTINGVRSIEVTENNRRFKFRDTRNGLEVERPNGKGGVQRATYQDANDLRAKDAEAYGHYQRAGGDKANGLGGMALPLLGNPPNGDGGFRPRMQVPNQLPLLNLPEFPKLRLKQPHPTRPGGKIQNAPKPPKPQRIEV